MCSKADKAGNIGKFFAWTSFRSLHALQMKGLWESNVNTYLESLFSCFVQENSQLNRHRSQTLAYSSFLPPSPAPLNLIDLVVFWQCSSHIEFWHIHYFQVLTVNRYWKYTFFLCCFYIQIIGLIQYKKASQENKGRYFSFYKF